MTDDFCQTIKIHWCNVLFYSLLVMACAKFVVIIPSDLRLRQNYICIKFVFWVHDPLLHHWTTLILASWHHMVTEIWVNTDSGKGLLPNDTKPLPETMLTNHQWGPATSESNSQEIPQWASLKLAWKLILQIYIQISQGPWVKHIIMAQITWVVFGCSQCTIVNRKGVYRGLH